MRIRVHLITIIVMFSFSPAIFQSCTGKKEVNDTGSETNEPYRPGFEIIHTDSCTILTIFNPWQGAQSVSQKFYLVGEDDKKAFETSGLNIIHVPVSKIVCTSTTHLAMISALGEEESVIGFSGTRYIYDTLLLARAAKGLIRDVGYDSGINFELLMALKPDLYMAYGIGSESLGFLKRINEMGIPVMMNGDYLEEDPLGKSDWLKVFGALYCKENEADSITASIRKSYDDVKKMISEGSFDSPTVLCGMPFRDTWYISPGNSYISRLISDAGGKYIWADVSSAISMPYSIESVFSKASEAEFWLNPGNVSSLDQIKEFDIRLTGIKAYRLGNVFNNNARMNKHGGNDYWESGVLHPHVILLDIAAIFNKENIPNHNLMYFTKLDNDQAGK